MCAHALINIYIYLYTCTRTHACMHSTFPVGILLLTHDIFHFSFISSLVHDWLGSHKWPSSDGGVSPRRRRKDQHMNATVLFFILINHHQSSLVLSDAWHFSFYFIILIMIKQFPKSLPNCYSIFGGHLQKMHFFGFVLRTTLAVLKLCQSCLHHCIQHYFLHTTTTWYLK